jgi:hypothetical protein
VFALILVGVLAYVPGWFSVLGLIVGMLLFFVTEYTTHRFLLHASPQSAPFVLRLQHRLHYDHHVTPDRLDLLFLPLWFAIPALALYGALYFAVTRSAGLTLSLLLGSVIALFFYEWVHYVAHIPFAPVTPAGRYMKKYHLLHHFKNERLWFGVTNPSMDFIGRTYLHRDEAEKSSTTRHLFKEIK